MWVFKPFEERSLSSLKSVSVQYSRLLRIVVGMLPPGCVTEEALLQGEYLKQTPFY